MSCKSDRIGERNSERLISFQNVEYQIQVHLTIILFLHFSFWWAANTTTMNKKFKFWSDQEFLSKVVPQGGNAYTSRNNI